MNDIDALLGSVRALPVPARLAALDRAVLDAIAQPAAASGATAARPIGIAAVLALAIGILSAVPGSEASAETRGSLLAGVPPLAPSSLLGRSR